MLQKMNSTSLLFNFEGEEVAYANQGKLIALGWVMKVSDNLAWVVTERKTGCSSCTSQSGCGTSTLAKLFSPKNSSPIVIENSLGVKEGDQVLLSIVESHLFKHSLMAYGLPLMTLMMFSGLGLMLSQSDVVSIIAGFFGLFIGWWFTHVFYQPVLPQLEKIIQKSEN